MVKESRKAKQVQWTNVYLDALVRYMHTHLYKDRHVTSVGKKTGIRSQSENESARVR